jgi:ribose-phosphate pyrophosphokinase
MLVQHVQRHLMPLMKDPVVVAADLGFAKKGRNFAADIDTPIAFVEKRRASNDSNAQALSIIGDVKGHDVIVIDDEVDTGGSISQAVHLVKREGAGDVYLIFVHAILSANAAEKISKLPVKQIITTDTVPIPASKMKFLDGKITILSVCELLGEVIKRAHEGRSVGQMFNE